MRPTDVPVRFQSVDILKCLAILMVLTVHQGQLFKHTGVYELTKIGQLGCQCFFVISGFTLYQSWHTRKTSISTFYKRRFWAIAPGYYFDIILFTAISLSIQFLNIPVYWRQPDIGIDHLWNLLFLHGLSPSGINTIVPGGWYIGTTMLMYLTFPLLMKAFDRLSRAKEVILFLLPLVGVSISTTYWSVTQLITSHYDHLGNNTFVYFNVLTQYPCFMVGGVIGYYTQTQGVLMRKGSLIRCITCACLCAAVSLLLFYSGNDFLFCLVPFTSAAFFGCLLLLMIKLIDNEQRKIPNPFMRFFSKISGHSYEMYLMHTLFIYFLTWYIIKAIKHFNLGYLLEYTLSFLAFLAIMTTLTYFSAKGLKHLLNFIHKK